MRQAKIGDNSGGTPWGKNNSNNFPDVGPGAYRIHEDD